jgi:hypothetical protein
MGGAQQAYISPSTASRLPEAMRIAREIMNNPAVSPAVRAIAASVIRRNGLPLKLDS